MSTNHEHTRTLPKEVRTHAGMPLEGVVTLSQIEAAGQEIDLSSPYVDPSTKRTPAEKIRRGARAYRTTFGVRPDVCRVSPENIPEPLDLMGDLPRLVRDPYVRTDRFIFGLLVEAPSAS